jgi:EamA-like transporter family
MSDAAIGGETTVRYMRGALYGLAAVSIWSGWIVVSRLGLRTSLTPWDIAALRFGVAGILLLPYVLVQGLALERLGGVGLAAIVFGGAAPVLLANSGLLFASAAHAGALFPGVMPLMVALLAAAFLQETFTTAKKFGFTLILPVFLGSPGVRMEASVHLRMLATCCSLALDWHGLSIRLRCVGRALADCMRRLSQPSGLCSCICRHSHSRLGQRSPKHRGVTSFCKVSSKAF